jgi:hypothetical protein
MLIAPSPRVAIFPTELMVSEPSSVPEVPIDTALIPWASSPAVAMLPTEVIETLPLVLVEP